MKKISRTVNGYYLQGFKSLELSKMSIYYVNIEGKLYIPYSHWFCIDHKLLSFVDEATEEEIVTKWNNVYKNSKNYNRETNVNKHLIKRDSLILPEIQRAGIVEILKKDKYVLLADEQGLGKTVETIVALDNVEAKNILIVSKKNYKAGWVKSLANFSVSKKGYLTKDLKDKNYQKLENNAYVINYDEVKNVDVYKILKSTFWDLIIFDEFQTIKNFSGVMYKRFFGGKIEGKIVKKLKYNRLWCLSGTPFAGKSKFIWSYVKLLDPEGLGKDFMFFMKRYCGGQHVRHGAKEFFTYEEDTNTQELALLIRERFLIRRKLNLKNPLKKKYLDYDNDKLHIDRTDVINQLLEYHGTKLEAKYKAAFTKYAAEFVNLGKQKIPIIIERIKYHLDKGQDKMCIYFKHHEVKQAVMEYFKDISIDNSKEVNKLRFAMEENLRCFFGMIGKDGTSITLTSANLLLLAELWYNPDDLYQVFHRIYRHGQERPCKIEILNVLNTFDDIIFEVLKPKKDLNYYILDHEW